MFGTTPPDSSTLIRKLQSLTERLGATDLTASESQTLLPEIHRLLELADQHARAVPTRTPGDRPVHRNLGRCAVA